MADDRLLGRRLGGFEVIDVLGRGGFATVYRARQLRLGRDVALKVLDPVLARDADAARRFDREGWAAAGLDHPGIVPVYEAGEEDGTWYLAMRLVNGRSLAHELAATGTLQPERAAAVVRAVADALDHAHSRSVLHRDVKPANILLEDDRVWLSDFGIAATTHNVGAYTTGAIGTADYMAPEQARPGEADARTDLYALGCVTYECLLGGPPFKGRNFPELLYAHSYEPIPRTGDAGLDTFLDRALAKTPDDRFQSGGELAAELDAVAGRLTAAPSWAAPTLPPMRPLSPEQPPTEPAMSPASPHTLAATPPVSPPPTIRPPTPTIGPSTPKLSRSRRRLLFPAGALVTAGAIATVLLLSRGGGDGGLRPPHVSTLPPTPATPATLSLSQAAVAYTDAVQPVNAAQAPFANLERAWTASTSSAQAQAQAAPLLAAVQAVQPKLAAIADGYQAGAADLRADANAAGGVQRALLELSSLNAGVTVATFRQVYDANIAKLIAASNAVRKDLGLPPTSQ